MFRTFIGRAGTGKSTEMLNEIKQKMKEQPLGHPIIIITPMQGTYLYEQSLVSDTELMGSIRTEVLHFERLSHRVFQELGGVHEKKLSSIAIEMMIYDILQAYQQQLKLYRSQVKYLGFSTKVREQIQDFEKYAVTPEIVMEMAQDQQLEPRTRDKLHDIGLIFNQLKARMSSEYISSEDLMTRFVDLIPNSNWLKEAEIYIDGFHNFSTQEYQVIEALVRHTRAVTVLLTTNGDEDSFSMFRKPSESLQHLEEIAQDTHQPLQRQFFNQPMRFKTDMLKTLESQFDALQPSEHPFADGSVEIREVATTRDEVNDIARTIIRDVREKQYRYKDIAILYRDPSYVYLMESILPQFDIPFNIDVKKSMTHHPIMEMLRALAEVIQTEWQFEPLMRLLKTNILTESIPRSRYLIDILENFAIERGIYGKRWIDPKYFELEQFRKMGLRRHDKMTREEAETFQRVIDLKNNVFNKLLKFQEKLSQGKNARDFATYFYETLEDFEVPNQLMTQRDRLDQQEKHEAAEEIDQIWNGFIRVLDDIVTVFDTREMTLKRFLEVLDVGLNELEFSMIPQTIDQVTIGSMDLAKVDNKKHVYLIGMNDGIMPQPINGTSLISDEEKKDFELYAGIQLSPTADILQMDEAFVCYHAMTRACEQVTFSYSLMDTSGGDREKSPFLSDIFAMFPHLETTSLSKVHERETLTLVEHPHQTKVHLFEALKTWLDDGLVSDIWFTVYHVMSNYEQLNEGLSHLKTALSYNNDTVQLDTQLTSQLYGQSIHASVSRFEGYQSCPFKHYASHGLRLNERTKYQLQSFDLGTIFHDVLRYIAEKVEGHFNQLTQSQIERLTQEALDELLPLVQFNLLNSTSYYRYLSQRIGTIIQATLMAMKHQTEHSQFRPIAFEKSFRKTPKNSNELQAETLKTKQGVPIYIRGQIDRIDTFHKNNKSFINIIDYKSSKTAATLDLVKVYYGLQMQMMTYMDIALQNKERLGLIDEVKPGGFLYMFVHKFKDEKRAWNNVNDDQIEAEFLKSYQLQGLLNQDADVIDAYDKRLTNSFKSDIVPLGMKKDGQLYATSRVTDEDTIHKLIHHNKRNFIDIASRIMDGHNEVAPMQYQKKLPCSFCQYQSVCHVDSMIDSPKYRRVDEKIDPLEILAAEEEES
ncbi:helicase-exonuclease AddAB subunit AddB [Staphylococcus schleiferi]|uniref:Exonuclease RexB n=1 Tax=Staphylococcus schleiferi TaxID=1295 RepID=A0A7Z7QR54_STASC|nr:helicase-exonuclease AddAB subunit AddB [Staphylococcus schleiferi]QGS47077.1 helicase-exonuclease AddAB subunit AddB [Mammaliicoccus fleurettii]MBF1992002.1 helicase-exonuclease AddAB subunit AddB [Staphylococcus schleiferi]MBF2037712.1 helicase-exonuclease AddAB subunit AddB [Staphylococcus schleiferi]MBF2099664.1 helicase-exonuclease AddAB subunit AddB [Staphylococcus schleiferi]MBF2101629.1 helicase-exonuclease AddAB subunit AddB [Staphylococcus schleiferi]